MNYIKHLNRIASKEEKLILGLMSGTSMDGLDLALCRITGSGVATTLKLNQFKTVSFTEEFRKQLKNIVSVETCSLQDVCLMNTYIGDYIAGIALQALEEWQVHPSEVDCIASHGQTIYHAPVSRHQQTNFPNATLQIGDGDHVAYKTGVVTLSDFRQKHTAAGGEGAPLVSLVDELLFQDPAEHRLLLNIGGIANFTYLPASDNGGVVITTDTGPGNTLLDKTARRRFHQPFDKDGKIAAKGTVDEKLLKVLKEHSFFDLPLPKTTGPELFGWKYIRQALLNAKVEEITSEDLMATLLQFTVETIAESVRKVRKNSSPLHIYISGGGVHNPVLLDSLKKELNNATIKSFEQIGFNPDAKEAACFAVLANETLSGEGFAINPHHPEEKVKLGKISFP